MSNIIDITLENFQQVLLEQSKETLVMVQFWADWCEACKQLTPSLFSIASKFPDNLILARVNCDEQQQIAAQFGVKSLPTVAIMKDSQPIDGFSGVQSEAEILELVNKHLPQEHDTWYINGVKLAQEGNWLEAYPLFKNAFEADQSQMTFLFAFANASIELGKLEDAKTLLDSVLLVNQDTAYQQLIAKLDLASNAADSPEIINLQMALEKEPSSLELKQQLALALSQVNRNEEALELLFEILKADMNFGEAKKFYLDIIANLPDGDVLAGKYRRKLYTLLY
ncbi:tetratricopeptide repeat protein [uncultured Psychrosphaera sp.]|uniref:tetratricopeptide repeat protein n=1 Tax=uncultured Psychrosphaera sp. TaxID=1403522 RepID=UPI00260B8347|nr:tetratricopeptide repeat protein [uncultured Psychrosphaera sp.]